MDRKNKIQLLLNILLLVLFAALVTYITIKYAPGITHLISKPARFKALLSSYGPVSILVFVFFQILQVVIAVIPGEFVQVAGGYVYGILFGTIYSVAGILCGSVIAFYISRILGFRLLQFFIPQPKIDKFNFIINSSKSEITLFLLFLIPGIPKDILVYIAGLTPVKPLKFFIVFVVARFPGIFASSFVGAHIRKENYIPVVIVSAIASILFVTGFLMKDKVIHQINRLLHSKDNS